MVRDRWTVQKHRPGAAGETTLLRRQSHAVRAAISACPAVLGRPTVSRIAISLCGEGRGHATRVSTLVGRLEADHDVLVWTSADALTFLRQQFATGHPRVRIEEVPGVVFEYSGGRLDVMKSIAAGLDYQARLLGPLVDQMLRELEIFGADLAIADFEPALPRAAGRMGIPLVSVDHQHFLLTYDLDSLPRSLQWNAWFMSHAVWMYVMEASDTVVSAFFRPPLRRGWEHVVQVGPLLRREILDATPRDDGFILSYLRRHTPFSAIEALADCGMPVRVYGLGQRDAVGQVSFHAIDERAFVADLTACRGLVSAAGNQLIGEALHLGKPLLVLPERAHAEQTINAHFLAAEGCGEFVPLERVDTAAVRGFLDRREMFAASLATRQGGMDGLPAAARAIATAIAPDAGLRHEENRTAA